MLDSLQLCLVLNELLQLKVDFSYFYGVLVDGNCFIVKLLVVLEVYLVDVMKDIFFGDFMVDLFKFVVDVIDVKFDVQGQLVQDVLLFDDVKLVVLLVVMLFGSVYESGGCVVMCLFKCIYWLVDVLVGVRLEFDFKQGVESESLVGFEIVCVGVDGKCVVGSYFKVCLQCELCDFYWLYECDGGWKFDVNQCLQLIDEKDVDVSVVINIWVEFFVEWGSYCVEVYDFVIKFIIVFLFFVGYSWDDENLGKEVCLDKVKLVLDKVCYCVGDIMKVIVILLYDGFGVLLVEFDYLFYIKNIDVKVGVMFLILVIKDWECYDVYVVVLVFCGGEVVEYIMLVCVMGVEYVVMDCSDCCILFILKVFVLMCLGNLLDVIVQVIGLVGKQVYVMVLVVDQGVINIIDYVVFDVWLWMFVK